ncbi:hypothetical protein D9M70_546070 [compost metagenome]
MADDRPFDLADNEGADQERHQQHHDGGEDLAPHMPARDEFKMGDVMGIAAGLRKGGVRHAATPAEDSSATPSRPRAAQARCRVQVSANAAICSRTRAGAVPP